MIFVKNTPNNAGVAIYGDYLDFKELYEALHIIVGGEDEYPSYEAARIRVLAVCYDLRHALMGNRQIEFVDNGLDAEKMKRLSMIAPSKNIYLTINVLWPEILFVAMTLNDFVLLHARKQAKSRHDPIMDKKNIWDATIAQIRMFQASIAKSIRENLSQASFSRIMNIMNHHFNYFDSYATQYLDMLNCRFLDMDKEKRLKNLPVMAKRIAEQGEEYREVKSEVLAAAREYNCTANDIRLQLEYPEYIEW